MGLGVIGRAGMYGLADPGPIYDRYLESVVGLARWLIERGHEVRLLVGDLADVEAKDELRERVLAASSPGAEGHLVDEPITSVDELVAQISAADVVVATRFHNVLVALLCGKPAVSISFHHKSESLMRAMELSRYSVDVGQLDSGLLIDRFREVEGAAERLRPAIGARVEAFRAELDRQYESLFAHQVPPRASGGSS